MKHIEKFEADHRMIGTKGIRLKVSQLMTSLKCGCVPRHVLLLITAQISRYAFLSSETSLQESFQCVALSCPILPLLPKRWLLSRLHFGHMLNGVRAMGTHRLYTLGTIHEGLESNRKKREEEKEENRQRWTFERAAQYYVMLKRRKS